VNFSPHYDLSLAVIFMISGYQNYILYIFSNINYELEAFFIKILGMFVYCPGIYSEVEVKMSFEYLVYVFLLARHTAKMTAFHNKL